MSLGGASDAADERAAIQYASDHGVIVCMSSGNDGATSPAYPANYALSISGLIAVGATDITSGTPSLAYFSNHTGSYSAYSFADALGVNIQGYTQTTGTEKAWSGTSMAAPLITALAADLLSANNALHLGLTAEQIAHYITQSAGNL
jgi:subtilisin family serine protease